MKLVRAAVFLLLFTLVARADFSPTIREVDRLEDSTWILHIYCDVPRGNVVYVAHVGGFNGISVAVIHQPDMCK